MLLQTRPLYDNRADARFFSVPPKWDALARAVERHLNVLVVGPRGVGKTTLLRQLQRSLREDGERVAFVDAAAVPDVLDLTSRIRDALLGQPAPPSSSASAAVEVFRADPAPLAGASRALASLLRSIGGAEPTTVLVDGSGSAESVYALFGRMRDVLWQQEHCWVVSIDEGDRATALKPPADAFFDVVLTFEPWPPNDLVALLMRRVDNESPLERDLVINAAAGANGSPREALRALADAVVRDRDPRDLLTERARLLDDASALGRAPAMLMAELLDRGEASSSDEALQVTLGMTRSRLTQLFRELLRANLVVAGSERANGPGRPRTVYRPALPS